MGWYLLLIKNYLLISNLITLPDIIDDILSGAIFCLIFISIIYKKLNHKNFIFILLVGAFALYTAYQSGLMIVTTTVLTIFGIYKENKYRLFKNTIIFLVSTLILNTLLSLVIACITGDTSILCYYIEEGRLRISLGYGMAGHLADCIFNLFVLYTYIKGNKLSTFDNSLLFIIGILTYLITDSKLILCLGILFPLLINFSNHNKEHKTLKIISIYIAPACTLFMLIAIMLYAKGNAIGFWLDKLLTSRIRLCGYNLDKYGCSLFGQLCDCSMNEFSFKWLSRGITFDNGYIYLMVNVGIFWLMLIYIVNLAASLKGDTVMYVYVIIFSLGLMVDTDFLISARLAPVLILGDYSMNVLAGNYKSISKNMQIQER